MEISIWDLKKHLSDMVDYAVYREKVRKIDQRKNRVVIFFQNGGSFTFQFIIHTHKKESDLDDLEAI